MGIITPALPVSYSPAKMTSIPSATLAVPYNDAVNATGTSIVSVLLVTVVTIPLLPLIIKSSVSRDNVSLPTDPLNRKSVTNPVSCDPSPLNEPVIPADEDIGPCTNTDPVNSCVSSGESPNLVEPDS